MSNRGLLGRWGERRCEKFLRRKGLKTLTRNFSCKGGEIDIVMVDVDGTVVFVEVKTRADESFDNVESAITPVKKSRLLKTARYFLASYNIGERPFRFDVVSIVLGKRGREQIRHYENAFVF
ncbi:MAG: YraN family protein [Planctomycetes bacterium]|nr:YraN family protein [Planctomycetota bacterium]